MDKIKLYKYRSINEHTKDIFKKRKIYFAKPTEFNDPFDCQINFTDNITAEVYKKYLELHIYPQMSPEQKKDLDSISFKKGKLTVELHRHMHVVRHNFVNTFKNLGILTLSEVRDNLLMWSHYAKNHTGLCIEFDIPVSDSIVEVKYRNNYPIITYSDLLIDSDREKKLIQVMNVKSLDWAYEKERRLYIKNGGKEYDLPGDITSIYFGCKCDENNINEIKKLCNGFKKCRFVKFKLSKTDFKLEIK